MDTAKAILQIMKNMEKSKEAAIRLAYREKKHLACATLFIQSVQFTGYKLEFAMFSWGTSPTLPDLSNHPESPYFGSQTSCTWEVYDTQNLSPQVRSLLEEGPVSND